MSEDPVWEKLLEEGRAASEEEPILRDLIADCLLERNSLEEALSARLARKLCRHALSAPSLKTIFREIFHKNPLIGRQVRQDIIAVKERDPATTDYLTPFLFQKGFQALTGYRLAHALWQEDRQTLACYLQSLLSEEYTVDIHPAARIGCGIMLDHATSFVVGETAVIEDNVSILHEVTLGGTGKESGDRHPKVRSCVLIGAGAKILGNVEIGKCAKVGAGAVVLSDVPPHATVTGVPAKVVGEACEPEPAFDMDHKIC